MKTHLQRYQLINVGPQRINKVIEIQEHGITTFGLEEWLHDNLGHAVSCYYTEDLPADRHVKRTKLTIKDKWGVQKAVGRAIILYEDDAVVLDMDSYKKMFERRERERQCKAM